MDIQAIAAIVFAVVAGGVVVFQFALALGAPWGAYAMGGSFPGRFPPPLRVAAVVQGLVIALFAVVVLSDAGVVLPEIAAAFPWLIWVPVAVSALAVVLNAISRSAGERRISVPVAVVLLTSSLRGADLGAHSRTAHLGAGCGGAPRVQPDRGAELGGRQRSHGMLQYGHGTHRRVEWVEEGDRPVARYAHFAEEVDVP